MRIFVSSSRYIDVTEEEYVKNVSNDKTCVREEEKMRTSSFLYLFLHTRLVPTFQPEDEVFQHPGDREREISPSDSLDFIFMYLGS